MSDCPVHTAGDLKCGSGKCYSSKITGVEKAGVGQSINQSSFNNGITERKPTIHTKIVHRMKSRSICLICFFIENPYDEVRV